MIQIKDVTLQEVDALIIPVFEEAEIQEEVLTQLMASEAFKGKADEVFVLPSVGEKVKYTLYVGVGKIEEFETEDFKHAMANAVKKAKSLKVKSLGIQIALHEKLCVGGNVKAITQAALLGLYSFDKYKAKKEEEQEMSISICGVPEAKNERANSVLSESKNIVEGIILARDLTNEPSNAIYPETLADKVVETFKDTNLEVEVLDEVQIEALGMKAFLAVGGSSTHKPRLIIMRHKGSEENEEVLGLVGKGLTYDTGGYSIKPTNSMKTMHSDMGGAAAVIGAMYAISKNNVPQNVTAVVAACENVIAPDSYKPGDIIGSMAGKTIEIGNTDAEGRLTLADAVTYIIEKENVQKVVDVATLTGAALVALGTEYTGVITNNDAFYDEFMATAEKVGEKFWRLPNDKVFAKMNKSTVADLKNIGGPHAGTITAGLFVGEFVQELPWIHLDIAGTAWSEKSEGYLSQGGTGVPVKTLYGLVAAPCPCGKHK